MKAKSVYWLVCLCALLAGSGVGAYGANVVAPVSVQAPIGPVLAPAAAPQGAASLGGALSPSLGSTRLGGVLPAPGALPLPPAPAAPSVFAQAPAPQAASIAIPAALSLALPATALKPLPGQAPPAGGAGPASAETAALAQAESIDVQAGRLAAPASRVRTGMVSMVRSLLSGLGVSLADGAQARLSPADASPQTQRILARARSRGIDDASIGVAVQSSRSMVEAAEALMNIGVLESGEASLAAPQERQAFNLLLHELWFEVAPASPHQFEFDFGEPIPATVVRREGVEFHIHGIAHGTQEALWGRDLIGRQLDKLKAIPQAVELYSEQNFPGAYGYADGIEFLDHRVMEGRPIALQRPQPVAAHAPTQQDHVVGLLEQLKLELLLQQAYASMQWAQRRLLEPVMNALRTGIDLLVVRRSQLPYPMTLSFAKGERIEGLDDDPRSTTFRRSMAMAAAALEDALSRGIRQVHVFCGFAHAWQMAWALSELHSPFLEAARAEYRSPRQDSAQALAQSLAGLSREQLAALVLLVAAAAAAQGRAR